MFFMTRIKCNDIKIELKTRTFFFNRNEEVNFDLINYSESVTLMLSLIQINRLNIIIRLCVDHYFKLLDFSNMFKFH